MDGIQYLFGINDADLINLSYFFAIQKASSEWGNRKNTSVCVIAHDKSSLASESKSIAFLDKQVKSWLAVPPAYLKLCDINLRRAQADSRNKFVEKAVEFYAGYLNAEQNPKLFDEMFTSGDRQKMEQFGKSSGTLQYKISIEQAKLCRLVSTQMHVTDDLLKRLHQNCSEEAKALGINYIKKEHRLKNRHSLFIAQSQNCLTLRNIDMSEHSNQSTE